MKKLFTLTILALTMVSFATTTFAGSCGGCSGNSGDKKKEKTEESCQS
jgi:hypothetical protein